MAFATATHDLNRAWWAAGAALFFSGFILATWVTRIPNVAEALNMDTGVVGTEIFGMTFGALLAMVVATLLLERWHSREIALGYSALFALGLGLAAVAQNPVALFLALFVFGVGFGGLNVSINANAAEVEAAFGRPMMPYFHGFYSVGGLVGTLFGSAVISLGLTYPLHFLIITVAAPFAFYMIHRSMIADDKQGSGDLSSMLAIPPVALLGLGAIAFASSVGEGGMGDWTALYLEQDLALPSSIGVMGYAAFSLCMVIGRFSAPSLLRHISPTRMVFIAGSIAALGLGIGLWINSPVAVIAGFGFVGLGLSVMAPLTYSAAANTPGIPRGRGIAAVATLGYSGYVIGPPILGWFAEATSLRAALYILVALAAAIVLLSPAVRR